MLPGVTHIFFDLDGTLVDSFPDIEHSALQAIQTVLPGRTVPDLHPFIGPPIREIFRRVLEVEDPGVLDRLVQEFRRTYGTEGWIRTQSYPGVPEGLSALHDLGLVCHVLTNKPQRPTHDILEKLSLASFLGEVISPDSRTPGFGSKTEAALDARLRFQLAGPETLVVGDSTDDAAAAAACGFHFAATCYGYGHAHCDRGCNVHYRLQRFEDLLPLFGASLSL